jgi:hypothetical protein
MHVRKYCLCGVKLERDVSDEETARRVIALFRREHGGEGHGVATRAQYERAVSRIIQAHSNRKDRSPRGRVLQVFQVIKGGK